MNACKYCGAVISHSAFSVDLTENTITIDGEVIKIKPSEADVAEIMTNTYPRTATKEFLYRGIYGVSDNQPESDKVFAIYVCGLRKKIAHTRLKILTTWGVGYRFELKDK